MHILHSRSLVGGALIALTALALTLGSTTMPSHTQTPAAAATMKAVRIHGPGGRDVLKYEDAPIPVPADDEMLIRVIAAGINPVDYKIRSGGFGRMAADGQPVILGFDIAGVVEKIGAKVTRFKAGDAVYAFTALSRGGGYAQFAVAKEAEAALKPKSLSFVDAAAVPLAALTAWQAMLDAGGLKEGQTVLIHGGSGGVGSFAIQIAKAKGARVIATASTANQDFLKELGADVAIDYKTQKFEDIAKGAGGVDVVLDTVGAADDTQRRSFDVLKKGGIIVSIVGMPDQALAKEKEVRATGILVKPDAAQLAEIASLIESGKIKVIVSQTFPLQDVAKAHEAIETGHTRGKIVLIVAEEPKQ